MIENNPKYCNVTRRQFMKGVLGVSTFYALDKLGITVPSAYANGDPQPPNLVFVFSDQQSFDMLGCYGNTEIITPNIDTAAAEGVRFSHCVSQTCVCSPYRAMLMSGQHPLYNGVFSNDVQMLLDNGPTFAEVLLDRGYRTGYIGKWHLYGGYRDRPIPPGPHRLSFDDTFLSNNCTLNFQPGSCFYWNDAGEKVYFDKWEPYGQTDQALAFLDGCTTEQPFSLFVSWHPPHNHSLGYEAPADLMALYDPAAITLRPNVTDTPEVRTMYHGHMAMCTGLDIAFGQIMQKLQDKGLADNTIVVFTSDHGDLLKSHDRPWPKGFPEDESLRVPFIIRWPGHLPTGTSSDLLVGTLDLMPTLLGLMGATIPSRCQGQDLSSDIVAGLQDTVESLHLFHFNPSWRGVYTHRYTYAIENYDNPSLTFNVLYDKQVDPYQQNNLFDAPSHQAVQQQLHQMTQSQLDHFADPFVDAGTLITLCFGDTSSLTGPDDTGELPGRPIDLLNGYKAGDLDKDGYVDMKDLKILAEDWLEGNKK